MATESQAPEPSLAKLFYEGQKDIKTARTNDLFQELQERSLTDAEEDIIKKRVEHQRRMLEMYEKSEKRRKVAELMEMCPDLTEVEVAKALDLCGGKEDEAGHQLVTDESFVRRVRGRRAPLLGPAAGVERPRDFGNRPKLVELSNLDGSVFCGRFRGRGSVPAPKDCKRAETAAADQNKLKGQDTPAVIGQKTAEQSPADQNEEVMEEARAVESSNLPEDRKPTDLAQVSGESGSPGSQPGEKYTPDVKQHMLVKVTEDGQLVPVTSTGLKELPHQIRRAVGVRSHSDGSEQSGHAGVEPAAVSPPSVTKPSKAVLFARSIAKSSFEKQVKRLLAMDPVTRRDTLQELDVLRPAQVRRRRRALELEESLPLSEGNVPPAEAGVQTIVAAAAATAGPSFDHDVKTADTGSASPQATASSPDGDATEAGASSLLPEETPLASSAAAPEVQLPKKLVNGTALLTARSLSQRSARNQVTRLLAMKPDMRQAVAEQLDVISPDNAAERQALLNEAQPAAATETANATQAADKAGDAGGNMADAANSIGMSVASTKAQPAGISIAAGTDSKPSPMEERPTGPLSRLRAASSASKTSAQPALLTQGTAANMEQPSRASLMDGQQPKRCDVAVDKTNASASASVDSEETELDETVHGTSGNPSSGAESQETVVRKIAQASAPQARPKMSGRLGRLRKSSHKQIELVQIGTARFGDGWHNSGYIFPDGFVTRTQFRSSVNVDQLTIYESSIIGEGGQFWPKPTFRVVGMDRPDEPLIAGSCTGCWSQVLKRINAEIEALRKAGDPRPAPPKTAIAGPEYFGLSHNGVVSKIEELDRERKCCLYWEGREERDALIAGLPPPPRASRPAAPKMVTAHPKPETFRRRKRGRNDPSDDDEFEENSTANRWSTVSRGERYKKRCGTSGEVDHDNPLPDFVDPITLEPVVAPAISPYGHVMGTATWKAVLAEQGKCPFTQQPLRWSQIKVLTKSNISAYEDQIKR